MEATEKSVSNENGQFRKCVYPYCRNMAIATDDYCAIHQHSSLLVKNKNPKKAVDKTPPHKSYQCPKCEYHTIDPKGLAIHIGQKHKKAVKIEQKKAPKKLKAATEDDEPLMVTIVLTGNEALTVSVALALADMINADRFKDADKISGKILRAIVKQIPQHDVEEAS